MEGPKMLSGSQLVAKGVTKKVDVKLPELGLKEVLPSNSWLEQKQLQSALEARKHLIEVERIEKIGSLSHAVWRDDLKLAEVTQQTGSYWQHIGHNIGKHLFLKPEEALFLIEVNCLLLKHNDVTVSLQKAYSLCLSDISIAQYKVYASLSRLGYRVFRHKEPTSDDITANKNINVTNGTADNCTQTTKNGNHSLNNSVPCEHQMGDDFVEDNNTGGIEDVEIKPSCCCRHIGMDAPDIKTEGSSTVHSDDESDSMIPLIEADNIKVEIHENHDGSEIIENDINIAIEKTLKSSGIDPSDAFKGTGDEIPPMEQGSNDIIITYNEDAVIDNVNENIADYQNAVILTNNEEAGPNICFVSACMNTFDDPTGTIDVDDNANETIIRPTEINEIVNTDDAENSNVVNAGVVFSVDESGYIRIIEEPAPMAFKVVESNAPISNTRTNSAISNTPITNTAISNTRAIYLGSGSGTKNAIINYKKDIHHYETKIQKLMNRKATAELRTDLEGFNKMQDFYQQKVVSVNVPDEKYLPRNIFLHKAAYMLNIDIVRNQNASSANLSGDEADQIEFPTRADRGTDPPGVADLPRFLPNPPFSGSPRFNNPFPTYRPNFRSTAWIRHNYNTFYNSVRPQNYFFHPRYRFQPEPFRPQFMNYNPNPNNESVDSSIEMRKRNGMKAFHFNTIANIAMRFKTGLARPANVQALKNLLNSYNSQYGENYVLAPNFDIIESNVQQGREVIVLDDDVEPQRKKQRLNDASEQINSNLEKLKVLAANLKDLHAKNLAVSRYRRVFSNAIKTFNKSFKADLYLDANFEIKDKKLIVLDSSSDSDAVVTVEDKSKKKIKLNPFNILKRVSKNVNDGASTSRDVPILQKLSLNAINEGASTSRDLTRDNMDKFSPIIEGNGKGLLKYFQKAWVPGDEDFGRAEVCSREKARLDRLLFEAGFIYDILRESTEFKSWVEAKIALLKEIQILKQRAITLNSDFLTETESRVQPIIGPDCTDLRSALKQLAIIPTNKETPDETNLKIDFDVYNRDIHFKKTNPPKANFRVICLEESAPFPSAKDVAALHAKYQDGVPTVFAVVGVGSISYLQIKPVDVPVFIPDNGSA